MLCPNCSKLAFVGATKLCVRCKRQVFNNLSVLCTGCSDTTKQCEVCIKNIVPPQRNRGCGCGKK